MTTELTWTGSPDDMAAEPNKDWYSGTIVLVTEVRFGDISEESLDKPCHTVSNGIECFRCATVCAGLRNCGMNKAAAIAAMKEHLKKK